MIKEGKKDDDEEIEKNYKLNISSNACSNNDANNNICGLV